MKHIIVLLLLACTGFSRSATPLFTSVKCRSFISKMGDKLIVVNSRAKGNWLVGYLADETGFLKSWTLSSENSPTDGLYDVIIEKDRVILLSSNSNVYNG